MKNQRLKKISSLILLGIIMLLLVAPVVQVQAEETLPQPTQEFYVYDEANIVTRDVAQYITQTNEELFEQTGAQIVVAVVNSLEGEVIEEYSNELYREWGIGSEEEDNGILLLVALGDGEMRIEVGYGLEGAIPDGKAGEIRDQYILPNFQQDQYNQGILHGFQAILYEIEQEYEIEISTDELAQYDTPAPSQEGNRRPNVFQTILIIIGVIGFLFVDFRFFGGLLTFALLRSISRGGFRGGGGGNSGGGGSSGGGGASGRW